MKIPEPVRAVFDNFPLATLPAHATPVIPESSPIELAVYNLDEEGLPLDPKCLEAALLLLSSRKNPQIKVYSPYISSAETLPLLYDRKNVITSPSAIAHFCYPELVKNAEYKACRALVDTWIDDAWHETVMENVGLRDSVYSEGQKFPWPFSVMSGRQLDTHLDNRSIQAKRATGDDYRCTPSNMARAKMAFSALYHFVQKDEKSDGLSALNILAFSYVWPIYRLMPESALVSIIPEELKQYAITVRKKVLQLHNEN